MRRVHQAIPNTTTNTNKFSSKRPYTRFHRKPQIYPTTYQSNQPYKVETTYEEENMNNYISNIYKEKKYRSVLDPAAPNNKNIFIDTDSEHQKSDREIENIPHNNKKSAKLLIAKTESQYPDTYNSQNIFSRDGLVKGYYIKVNQNNNLNNNSGAYNTLTKNSRKIRKITKTPSPESETNYVYNKYNRKTQIEIRNKNMNLNNFNQTYNKNTSNNGFFRKEIDLDEWPSVDRSHNAKLYFRNKDIQVGEMKTDNSNNMDNENLNQYQAKKYPTGLVYRKGIPPEVNSKSNISDNSEDYLNQYKKVPIESNYIIAGNTSETGSPIAFKNNNNYIIGTSEEDSEQHAENLYINDRYAKNYMNKRIIKDENDTKGQNYGGKVDLYYGINNYNKDNENRNNYIINYKNKNLINIIKNDNQKLNSLIKLQKFIKSYLYLRELCAMKIQAVWRGGNTRRIMDLYNDLDEFIYHLSIVQFNHFNKNFCFFIKQLFNIYKASVTNGYLENEDIENNDINNEEENEIENENCMNQFTLEEIEKKDGTDKYIYKYPEGSYFDPEKLELENEIALFVEASSPYYERTNEQKSKEYERLIKDYEELYQQYNELKENSNNRFVPKKEKNESESAVGSNKNEFKFNKIDKNSSTKRENKQKNSEKRQKIGENIKYLTISNDYDADLDINRDDDFFNQEISYDDKDNSGSLIKDKRYSYFSLHSDENSKYFDNENPKEKEIKEGEIFKINTSKNSGSRYHNNSTKNTGYTGYTGGSSRQDKSKLTRLHKNEKINIIEYPNSPSIEKSNNYIGHHSKTFPRKYNNYKDSNNSALIIPKHEEDFNIINNKIFLSPKERESKIHIKNNRSDIATTSAIKFEDKNWNEIIEYIKNEEIEIPTQKRIKNQFKIDGKIFNILEQEKNNEININNEHFKQKKLEQIYIQHENELNIIRKKKKDEKAKELDLIKSIEEKDNQINVIKKKLEDITEKLKNAKNFDNKLEINNNLNTLNINGIKPIIKKRVFNKINVDKINLIRKPRKLISDIIKNNGFSIHDLKMIPETAEEITDTNDLIPKEIKIKTKKIVKKVDTIKYKFKNNLITSENAININGKEKEMPVLEEESQENNRFSVDRKTKEENAEKGKNIQENAENISNQELKEDKGIDAFKVKVINLEDLKIVKPFTYIISAEDESLKEKKGNQQFEVMKNNEISLNPISKREIKIVTKKVLKKTNLIYSKFGDNKTIISSQKQLDIKGNENKAKPEIVLQEKIIKEQASPEIKSLKELSTEQKEDFRPNEIKPRKKFDNIQLSNEEGNNGFCIGGEFEMPKIYKIVKINNPSEIVINRKSQFTINGNSKKPEENIINQKSKFTINGIQKEKVESKEEGIQFENNYDNLSEKMTDTNDLIPKEIKITTKKTVKKTNILKKYNNNVIAPLYNIKLEGIEKSEIEKESIKSNEQKPNKEINKANNWNNLQKEGQQYNFVIKRISKNIYKKYHELKNIKGKEENALKDDPTEDKKDLNINSPEDIEKTKEIIKTINPEKNWNSILLKENQKSICIENKNIPKSFENIIVKKINFNIANNKEKQEDELETKQEQIIYQSNWKNSLIEDSQKNKITIKGKDLNKTKINDIQKNIVLNIEPTNALSLAKNKVIENWNDSNMKQMSEMLSIENKKKREVKITTRKIMKKTNFVYKKFSNLSIGQNELDIKGDNRKDRNSDYKTENITVNINKAYEPKKLSNLEMKNNTQLFINANNYKKKEIKIRTKKTISKTNFVYKRFNNNMITNENRINIESIIIPKSTIISSFGNEKLEKVEILENKFTINKTIDIAKEKELKDKIKNEVAANLEIKYLKEKEDLQNLLEMKNNNLKKENEELKNIIDQEKEMKAKENNHKRAFNDIQPIATDEFTLEMEYNSEEEKNEISDNANENEKYYEDRDNVVEYDMEHIELIVEGGKKKPIEISEQENKAEEEQKNEDKIDTFDLESKKTEMPFEEILKKTNVLRNKNNFVCSDTKVSINTSLKDKNNIINKIYSFSIDNPIKNEKSDIYKINNKNIINKVNNIELFGEEMQKTQNIINNENTFGDTNQLNNVLLHNKPTKKITDKKQKNTISSESASIDKMLNIDNEKENGDEEEKKLYKKRKVMNTKIVKVPNKKKKFATLIIKLDNKFYLHNSFIKWNALTPNITKKNKSINIKQVIKEKSSNLRLDNIDSNANNERFTDTTNIEKSNEDSNQVKTSENNFETISIEHALGVNQSEGNDNINKSNKKKKIKNMRENLNIDNNIDLNKEIEENININKEEYIKRINDNNLNPINLEEDEIIDDNQMKKRNSINSNRFSSNEENSHLYSISNDLSSSIEINDKSSIDRNEQENIELPQQPEEPKKKEIIINKKVCIISKKAKKIKYAEAKKKFFKKRFLIKFWKIWKNKIQKEKERDSGKMKSLEAKDTKIPFSFKKKIHKRIIESEINKEKQISSLKNKIMSQNKELIIRHFFLKWNKDIINESNEFIGISVIEKVLRRHIVKFLVMHGKFLKFKKLMIKYALNHRHK